MSAVLRAVATLISSLFLGYPFIEKNEANVQRQEVEKRYSECQAVKRELDAYQSGN